jgi:predicted phage terminase large subunit-like protein
VVEGLSDLDAAPLLLECAQIARESLMEFTLWTFPQYLPGWCHELIAEELDQFLAAVAAKESPRLMILAPPRCGKTELVSRRFPAYAFGKFPDLTMISSSYSSDLTALNNRDVQRIIDSEEYAEIFPETKLASKFVRSETGGSYVRNTEIFEIVDHKGSYRAAGVGGGITGMGANILLIDDPIKDFKEARSPVIRESVWNWYTSTGYTRLAPGGGVLIIMTHWNEDDPAGRIIKQMESGEGDTFKIVRLKAIAEEDETYRKKGEALHPERYSLATLLAIKKVLGPYLWGALYQQDPKPGEGNIFNPAMMETLDAIPAGTKFVRAWDFAASKNEGDYTVGCKLGRMPDGRYIVASVIRDQWGAEDVEKALRNTAIGDGTICRIRIPQDPGQAGKAQAKNFIKLLSGFTVKALPISGEKVIRAMPFAAQVNVGNVVLLRAPWNESFKSELQVFDNGTNDDQVDAASDAFAEFSEGSTGLLEYYEAEAKKALEARSAKSN